MIKIILLLGIKKRLQLLRSYQDSVTTYITKSVSMKPVAPVYRSTSSAVKCVSTNQRVTKLPLHRQTRKYLVDVSACTIE